MRVQKKELLQFIRSRDLGHSQRSRNSSRQRDMTTRAELPSDCRTTPSSGLDGRTGRCGSSWSYTTMGKFSYTSQKMRLRRRPFAGHKTAKQFLRLLAQSKGCDFCMAVIQDDLVLNDRYSRVLRDYINNLNRASRAARGGANSNRLYGNSAANAARQTSGLVSTLRNLAGAFISIQGVKSLVSLSDEMASIRARLNMMNDGLQTTEELNQMIYESAQRSRGPTRKPQTSSRSLATLQERVQ